MAKQKTDLSAALIDAAHDQATEAPEPMVEPDNQSSKVQASRQGKVAITLHTTSEVRHQLKQLALDNQVTAQTLHAEAMNLLFEKYHKPPIA